MKQKTILVTGAAGFIGANFVRLALARGYTVIGLDKMTYAGHEQNLASISQAESFTLVKGDICDSTLLGKLFEKYQFSGVLNFAAESHVDRSIEGPGVFVTTNVLGTATMLDASLKYWQARDKNSEFRYLQVSTDEVFGSLTLEGSNKFSETTPLDPSSPYSATKAGADQLVQAWHHTFGLPTVITRCSNNYGPYQYPEKLIPTILTCARAGKPLPVYGKGLNVRDWIHVEDHCAGILMAFEKAKPGTNYCFGGHAEMQNIEVVKQICDLLDKQAPRSDGKSYQQQITFVTDRLGHDLRYAIDDQKAQNDLGFVRKHNFESGLAQTVTWYLNNQSWCDAVIKSARERMGEKR
jgi:dTDP-glucose 4,6-dehydratase